MAVLAVSLGDPGGIGPEIIAKSWLELARSPGKALPFCVIGGDGGLFGREEASIKHINRKSLGHVPVRVVGSLSEAAEVFADALPVMPLEGFEGAALARQSLEKATEFAISGEAAGLVTAPVAKHAMSEAGFAFPGQTEYLAAACSVAEEDTVMMLAGPSLRTVPVTIHCALAEVPNRLTSNLILSRARTTHAALSRDFGIAEPRLAICGLNPHAGEEGRMGDEEITVISPAIAQLKTEGIDATGPHSADTIFAPHARKTYDAVLAMYHDQALIPIKALDFDEGVNVTLGLPIVRTSPDHGTGFDIAGKGMARPDSMLAAIRLASALVRARSV